MTSLLWGQIEGQFRGTGDSHYETTGMTRLRREAHARMLGNGLCTRPVQLNCRMESACETCSYFQTTIEFRPTLQRQADHARDHKQPDRAALFDQLIQRVDQVILDNDHPHNGGSGRQASRAAPLSDCDRARRRLRRRIADSGRLAATVTASSRRRGIS
jgi:hypothetical protein